MAEDKFIPANIVVADRTYRLKIKPEEEEGIRRVMRELNAKIVEFKTSFAGKDMQDYISMCLIWYATEYSANGTSETESSEFFQTVGEQIDKVLKETE